MKIIYLNQAADLGPALFNHFFFSDFDCSGHNSRKHSGFECLFFVRLQDVVDGDQPMRHPELDEIRTFNNRSFMKRKLQEVRLEGTHLECLNNSHVRSVIEYKMLPKAARLKII